MTKPSNFAPTRRTLMASALVAGGAVLAGCGNADKKPDASASSSSAQSAPSAESSTSAGHNKSKTVTAGPLQVTDAWVKAADKVGGMTAAFGHLHNPSKETVTLKDVRCDIAGMVELHETVPAEGGGTQMRKREGGFQIPAGGKLDLVPGGNHIMLMKLKKTIEAGQEVPITLVMNSGGKEITASLKLPARVFDGAQEHYAPGEGGDHGSHDDHGHKH
ncbi:copper chaperone PCu(A)C [Devriesea agamarum]|uniref:copper chaperone PCu(A)C n=1 Tax=Devriesea agamarum TaxID=472569 RepID=UPI00071CECAC|nr:copper chaperone PCu(A)C [Devriesea agamarum]